MLAKSQQDSIKIDLEMADGTNEFYIFYFHYYYYWLYLLLLLLSLTCLAHCLFQKSATQKCRCEFF